MADVEEGAKIVQLPAAGTLPIRNRGNPSSSASRAARPFTTCQITFSVMPSPQTVPVRFTQRNTCPSRIGAEITHASTAVLTQSGRDGART